MVIRLYFPLYLQQGKDVNQLSARTRVFATPSNLKQLWLKSDSVYPQNVLLESSAVVSCI